MTPTDSYGLDTFNNLPRLTCVDNLCNYQFLLIMDTFKIFTRRNCPKIDLTKIQVVYSI